MANKFTVFVVFAAVAQASLASSAKGSSSVENARERSRTPWRAVGETICRAVRDKSWPISAAKEEYLQHLVDAGNPFLEAAPFGNSQDLRNKGLAATNILREGVFEALGKARRCKSYATTIAEIEKIRKQLPYKELTEAFHEFTRDTGTVASAQKQFTNLCGTFFAEIEKLAKVTCGGQRVLGDCDLNGIQSAVDVVVNTVFGWVEE